MNLQEQISRIHSMMGLLGESVEDKQIVLLDGTSSAGKSHTLNHLNAVPYYESTDKNQWVQIGSDMFVGDNGNDGEKRRLKLDHPNIRDWAQRADTDIGIMSGEHRKDGKDVPENPYEKEWIEGTDPRAWYIAKEIETGPWKKIVIDDIGKDILKYLPNVKLKHILLHTPIYLLLKNVSERNERAKNDLNYKYDDRKPFDVLEQYVKKYESTKSKPDENEGDPTTVLTKSGLTKLFQDNGLSEENIDVVLNELGIIDDGNYYIKVRDSYLTPETQLVNVDSERTVYLKDIDRVLN